MTCCTTDQTAEYVSTSLIGRHDTIRDHKCSRADMVCDQTDGYIILIGFPIFFAGNLTYQVTKCTDGIYVKDRINILYNNSQTFKAHTCINIFLFQSCIISVAIVFELSEYIVPYFHVTVAVTTYGTARFATPCSQKLSSLPKRKILSAGIPISLFQISKASSSS